MPEQPLFFCFCGPSASGKSTVCQELLRSDPSLLLSVSSTTRTPRADEQDGHNYHFISRQEFERRIGAGLFVEYTEYSKNLYGTELRNIEAAEESGRDLLLDIEVQGVSEFKRRFTDRVVTIFVFPPTLAVLKQRLLERGSESDEQRQLRLRRAEEEISVLLGKGFSDYLLINDRLEDCVAEAGAIVRAERLRLSRLSAERRKATFG